MRDNLVRDVKVVRVVDGDTFYGLAKLLYGVTTSEDEPLEFRMTGINTPEREAVGYEEAKQYLTDRIYGKTVQVEATPYKGGCKKDGWKRYLVTVFVNDVNINLEMLQLGLAVPYVKK